MKTNKKDLEFEVTRTQKLEADKLEITLWEKFVDEDADEGTQNKRRLVANFEIPTRMLNAFNELLYSYEEDLDAEDKRIEEEENNGKDYDDPAQDHQNTEIAAMKRNGTI